MTLLPPRSARRKKTPPAKLFVSLRTLHRPMPTYPFYGRACWRCWPLIYFTQWSVQRIFLAQLIDFLIAALAFSWTPLRILLVPRSVQRARAHRNALEQFVVRGISRTRNRCGVLIFVSLAEHYARIIADEGIAQKVHASEWQAAVDALTMHIRE